MNDRILGAAPTDAQLLDAYVAGCDAENELTGAELSPENVRRGIAAAIRKALPGAALEAGLGTIPASVSRQGGSDAKDAEQGRGADAVQVRAPYNDSGEHGLGEAREVSEVSWSKRQAALAAETSEFVIVKIPRQRLNLSWMSIMSGEAGPAKEDKC